MTPGREPSLGISAYCTAPLMMRNVSTSVARGNRRRASSGMPRGRSEGRDRRRSDATSIAISRTTTERAKMDFCRESASKSRPLTSMSPERASYLVASSGRASRNSDSDRVGEKSSRPTRSVESRVEAEMVAIARRYTPASDVIS